MTRNMDLLSTALAPAVWGSTYLVATELLPHGHPLTVAMLRALPAGVILMLFVREVPQGIWWGRVFVVGALNFSIFWSLLFIAAYRLPGGVAATVIALQPLMVVLLARLIIGTPVRLLALVAAIAGLLGVALLVLTPKAGLDPVGIAAGLAGAVTMSMGTVLSRHWQPPVSPLTFTAWQLAIGGALLLPVALAFEPPLPAPTQGNLIGFLYLGLIGGAITYWLWFRGLARLGPATVSVLALLSPVAAVTLGWAIAGENLGAMQMLGIVIVLGSVWLGQQAQQPAPPPASRAGGLPQSGAGLA